MPGSGLDGGHTAENKASHGAPVPGKGDMINKGTGLFWLYTVKQPTTLKLSGLKATAILLHLRDSVGQEF